MNKINARAGTTESAPTILSLQSHNTGRGRKIISQELDSSHQLENSNTKNFANPTPNKEIRYERWLHEKEKRMRKKRGGIEKEHWKQGSLTSSMRMLWPASETWWSNVTTEAGTQLSYARTWHVWSNSIFTKMLSNYLSLLLGFPHSRNTWMTH